MMLGGHALVLLAVLVGGSGCASSKADPPLPKLKLDATKTTVSGLSSGAYMATQAHLAFSDHIAGVAMIGGGPYGCAQGSIEKALNACLNPSADKLPDVGVLAEIAKSRAKAGAIAPLEGLAGDKVFVMHGTLDQVVGVAISADSAEFYRKLGGAVVEEDNARVMNHTFPTISSGTACDATKEPFVGSCGFDGAGEILSKLYAEAPVSVADKAEGELRRFDQRTYLPDGKDAMLANSGYVYIPKVCAEGKSCALHIAFHGCQQNAELANEAFVRDAGYNRWADARHLVVLYPQTRASYAPLNPKACWDWWGFTGADYDTRQGLQLRWLANAAAALGAPLE